MIKSKQRPKSSAHGGRQVILINGEPVRKKARREYDKARRDLEKAREQVERFKAEDQPAFDRWFHSHFGSQLTMLRELAQRYGEKAGLISEVQDVAFFEEVSMGEAYRRVMYRRAHPEEIPVEEAPGPGAGFGGDSTREDFPPRDEGPSDQQAFDDFSKAFRDLFGHDLPPGFKPPGMGPKPPPPKTGSRVKELYRMLVRKLHPDTQKEMTPQKLEWWHQVQEAYAAGDAERLEVILNLCEMEEGAPGTHTSVSMLKRIIAQLKSSLREVKRELSQYKREPAWNFNGRADRSSMEFHMRSDLDMEVRNLRRQASNAEALVNEWAKQAERISTRKGKGRGRRNREEGFFF